MLQLSYNISFRQFFSNFVIHDILPYTLQYNSTLWSYYIYITKFHKIFHLLFRTCGHHHAAIILFSLYEARALEEAENVFCTHIDTYVEMYLFYNERMMRLHLYKICYTFWLLVWEFFYDDIIFCLIWTQSYLIILFHIFVLDDISCTVL